MNWWRVLLASVGGVLAASPGWAAYSELVIFGDSLSDVGNVYSQTLGLAPRSPPSYQGRYSNGPLWVERLALAQGLPAPERSRSEGNNWAYAGTKTGSGSTNYFLFFNFPNLGTQIDSYLNSRTPAADQLFVVWGGGNDFIGGQANPQTPVNNIVNHVTALANAGAKTFLVPNLPLLGEVPRFVGTSGETTMNSLSSQFNSQLALSLANLETSLNIEIFQLDVAGFFGEILTNPSAYGFTNVTGTALSGSTVVANPDQYVFWDDIHPTRVAHSLLGTRASDVLDTRNWISTSPSGFWGTAGNWDRTDAPQARWIAKLENAGGNDRSAVVNANSTVRRIDLSGTGSAMRLVINANVSLASTERIRLSSGGGIELQGGTVNAPLLQNHGGTVEGFGTIAGDFEQNSLGRIKLKFPATAGPVDSALHITGHAALNGLLSIGLLPGELALPGLTQEVLTFGSSSGDVDVLNETGFAGLSFVKTFSATGLTLTTTATPGDANLDGLVNLRDLQSLAIHWQSNSDWLGGDFDQNGFVDAIDLGLLATNWQCGSTQNSLLEAIDGLGLPQQSVPEPAGLLIGLALLMIDRRAFSRQRQPILWSPEGSRLPQTRRTVRYGSFAVVRRHSFQRRFR